MYIEEHTTQWPKEKGQKDKQRSTKLWNICVTIDHAGYVPLVVNTSRYFPHS
jgi:hypothetical protein